MSLKTRFPHLLVACFALCLLTTRAFAQTDTRPRQVAKALDADGTNRLENDVYVVSEAPPEAIDLLKTPVGTPNLLCFNQTILSASDDRLGGPYVYGAL